MDPWGAFTRALGLVYFIALASLARQLPALSGPDGLDPMAPLLARKARHFGYWRARLFYPTLFWLSSSDAALAAVPALGALCGAGAVYGGARSPLLLLGAWLSLLSVDAGPSTLVYPWDSLLLEAGFLALFLPASAPLAAPTLAALLQPLSALPSPLLSFAFRALLFRLMVGFGKLKFQGSGWRDRFYIRSFLVNMPMATPAGMLAHRLLPGWAWVAMLAQLFVVECVAPFGLFFTGAPRAAAAAAIACLMAGIWLTGNFGYFNLATMALCLAAADGSAAGALRFSLSDLLPAGAPLPATLGEAAQHWRPLAAAAALLLYILPASLLQFVMNSWINLSWAHWGGVYRLRLPVWLWWTQAYARALRALGHARLVSGYGVFPPASSPPQRWALCFEGSADGVNWARYRYAHYLSGPRSAPEFLAPYHPRLDHAIFYESFGGSGTTMSCLGHSNPYAFHSSASAWVRLAVRLLQGEPRFLAHAASGGVLFKENPFPHAAAPPRHVRIVACQYTPLSAAEVAATGEHWRERVMGVQHAPISLDSLRAASGGGGDGGGPAAAAAQQPLWPLCDALPEPEEFWVECEEWRRRARVCSKGVTPGEYEEAWGFIEEVRRAAGGAAGEAAAAAAVAPPPPPPPPPPPFSPHEAVISQLSRRRAVAAPPAAALRAAAAALAAAPPHAPLPLGAANAAFTWAALPAVVAAVRARYSLRALAAIRGTLARLSVPLLRGAARVFDRVAPTAGEVEAELAELGAGERLTAAEAAEYRALPACMGATLQRSAVVGGVTVFAGNDDAGVEGCMANALRWQSHAHRLMLVGGRAAYEEAVGALLGCGGGGAAAAAAGRAAVVSPTPLALHSSSDPLSRTPRPLAWRHLTRGGACLPRDTATELGTFLLWTLSYDTLVTLAVGAHRVASQSRLPPPPPASAGVEGPPTFLPATIALMPRVEAHAALRRPHAGCSSLPPPAAARGFFKPCAVPLWRLSADEATWTEMEGTAE
jgi:hypothetical protein